MFSPVGQGSVGGCLGVSQHGHAAAPLKVPRVIAFPPAKAKSLMRRIALALFRNADPLIIAKIINWLLSHREPAFASRFAFSSSARPALQSVQAISQATPMAISLLWAASLLRSNETQPVPPHVLHFVIVNPQVLPCRDKLRIPQRRPHCEPFLLSRAAVD
jgi:hypothetical protein